MIKYYFVLFFLIGVLFFIHTVECFSKTTGYESIQEEYLLIRNSVDFEKATVYLLDVLGSKEAQSDLELRIWSQIHLANVLWASGRFDESYSYLQKIEKSIDLIDNNYLKSLFHQEYSQYYYQLGFINLSLQRNKEAISYAKTIKDTGLQKRILSYVYATRKVMFNALAQEDSALHYTYKSIANGMDSNNYTFLLNYYATNYQSDSVDKYLKILEDIKNNKDVGPARRFYLFKALGDVYLYPSDKPHLF